ncbi:MAG: dihydrolipoamide acetyltransferase family protein [Desulfatirhabdiaceae bacterium]
MAEFRMPSLGSDMVAGILVEWRVKPGDRVKRRDIIAVVETDKAAIEIEVYEDGVVERLLVEPGQKVPVGAVLAIIQTEVGSTVGRSDKTPVMDTSVQQKTESVSRPETEKSLPSTSDAGVRRARVSPYARRLAAEQSVDLKALEGTGPGGAICAADVKRAVSPAIKPLNQLPPASDTRTYPEKFFTETPRVEPIFGKPSAQTGMRRAIAAAMVRSKREIPHYYLQTRIDMSKTLGWLESENLNRPIRDRILPVVPLIRAVALALKDVPELNGYWIDDHHQISEAINIGFAISLRQGGLIAPAILNADEKCVEELMTDLRDLIMRTRSGGLRSSELTDATVTITSLGDLGVETVFGVIYPPQVALIGFGKTAEHPWAENGMLGVRPVLTATLSADHRATDGRRGAQFFESLNHHLQEPLHP